MARYFFDVKDGDTDTDDRGVELPGDAEAVNEAVRYVGAVIGDQPGLVSEHAELVVTVRTVAGAVARVRVSLEPA